MSEEAFVSMNEDEPAREIEATPPPEMETPDSAEPGPTDETIDKMKVKELRDELSKRGVNKSVLKENWFES